MPGLGGEETAARPSGAPAGGSLGSGRWDNVRARPSPRGCPGVGLLRTSRPSGPGLSPLLPLTGWRGSGERGPSRTAGWNRGEDFGNT